MTDYRSELLNLVHVRSEIERELSATAFMSEMADNMAAAEEIEDLKTIHFRGTIGRRLAGVDGYDIGDTDDSVALAIAHFDGSTKGGSLSRSDVLRLYGQLETYVIDAMAGTFHADREHADPAVQLALDLHHRARSITRFRLYLFTDLGLGSRFAALQSGEVAGIPVDYHVWDIKRLESLASSKEGRSKLDIDIDEWIPAGLPALAIQGEGDFETYLAAVPGALLADLYGRFGSRLLESNVRSFLSGRGNVNKGIRTTILSEAQMFLAYNNGITATATAVETSATGALTKVSNLQIVNGGQTTASLFYVRRDSSPKPDLTNVFVQMKLVVVDPDTASELVPKISRYANSQNRISEADFFSNSPFHVRMEDFSRRTLVPTQGSGHFQTKWFYERTRGQYQNEKAKLSPAEAKKFEAMYPRSQLLTKTDAAKYAVSWSQEPHKVSAGAQKNFVAFANMIASKWESSDTTFNERYYKELVAKGIIFNQIRGLVAKAPWYQSGYLANIVTYTVAKLAYTIEADSSGLELDLLGVWNRQEASQATLDAALEIALLAFKGLTAEQRPVQNVTEWAKREECWKLIRSAPYSLPSGLRSELVSKQMLGAARSEARANQRIDNSINVQMEAMAITRQEWVAIHDFARLNHLLSPSDSGIIGIMVRATPSVPSEHQAKRLLAIRQRVQEHGFVYSLDGP